MNFFFLDVFEAETLSLSLNHCAVLGISSHMKDWAYLPGLLSFRLIQADCLQIKMRLLIDPMTRSRERYLESTVLLSSSYGSDQQGVLHYEGKSGSK